MPVYDLRFGPEAPLPCGCAVGACGRIFLNDSDVTQCWAIVRGDTDDGELLTYALETELSKVWQGMRVSRLRLDAEGRPMTEAHRGNFSVRCRFHG
jgi:hypothetical protein